MDLLFQSHDSTTKFVFADENGFYAPLHFIGGDVVFIVELKGFEIFLNREKTQPILVFFGELLSAQIVYLSLDFLNLFDDDFPSLIFDLSFLLSSSYVVDDDRENRCQYCPVPMAAIHVKTSVKEQVLSLPRP